MPGQWPLPSCTRTEPWPSWWPGCWGTSEHTSELPACRTSQAVINPAGSTQSSGWRAQSSQEGLSEQWAVGRALLMLCLTCTRKLCGAPWNWAHTLHTAHNCRRERGQRWEKPSPNIRVCEYFQFRQDGQQHGLNLSAPLDSHGAAHSSLCPACPSALPTSPAVAKKPLPEEADRINGDENIYFL